MKRTIISLLTCIILSFSLSFSVLAEETIPAQMVPFEIVISRYFLNTDKTIVTGKDGKNITKPFFDINIQNYENKDYQAIREYINENVASLRCSMYSEALTERMGVTRSVTDYDTFLIEDSQGHRGYLTMTVGGNFVYDRNSGEISSAYNARLVKTEYTDFIDWTFQNKNVTTSSRISADKYTAYFTARIQSVGRYIHSPLEYDFGYHELTVTGQGGN